MSDAPADQREQQQPGNAQAPAAAEGQQEQQQNGEEAAPRIAISEYRPRDDLPDAGYRLRCTVAAPHGEDGAVTAVRFDPEARRLASAGTDGTAAIWDAEDGSELHRLRGHAAGISGGAAGPGAPPAILAPAIATPSRSARSVFLPSQLPLKPSPPPPDPRRRGLVPRRLLPGHRLGRHDAAGVGRGQRRVPARAHGRPHALRLLLRLLRRRQSAGEERGGESRGWGEVACRRVPWTRTADAALLRPPPSSPANPLPPPAPSQVSGGFDEIVVVWDVRLASPIKVIPGHSDPVSGVGFSGHPGLDELIASCSFDGLT